MGLSLRDASRLSGVSHTHIRDIEDGTCIRYPASRFEHRVSSIVTVQPYVKKLQWLTAETQRAHREDNFSFAVERTAKKNYSAALPHNNLMHYYSLPYHYEALQNAPKGLILIAFRPLNGKQ